MRAFISWSGQRGLRIAEAFAQWLKAEAPEIVPFTSPELPKGKAWFEELAKSLKDARIGFVCLTPPGSASAWQLLEAGASWKAAMGGGLFPVCFGVTEQQVADPLKSFQLTFFTEADFRRLRRDVVALVKGAPAAPATRNAASAARWRSLQESVDKALRLPDESLYTVPGFVYAVAGGWWERVTSPDGGTKLSWITLAPSSGGPLVIVGRGFGKGGAPASRWDSDIVRVNPESPTPTVTYYWEGRHQTNPKLKFGGRGQLRFTVTADGLLHGDGEFQDVHLSKAGTPTTKLVDLLRATPEEVAIMEGKDNQARRKLASDKLAAWP
jgi:hypothetical protein